MNDYKRRVERAVTGFYQRQEKKLKPASRKNQKPEKKTEKECLEWMRANQFDVQIVEAKAVFNPKRGRFISQAVRAGTVDCIGNDPNGFAVFVEFKAPGRLSTLRAAQKEFLLKKIQKGAFACVTDSAPRLAEIYRQWIYLKSACETEKAKLFLGEQLPVTHRCEKLFENELS